MASLSVLITDVMFISESSISSYSGSFNIQAKTTASIKTYVKKYKKDTKNVSPQPKKNSGGRDLGMDFCQLGIHKHNANTIFLDI